MPLCERQGKCLQFARLWNGILISLLYTLTKLAEIECSSHGAVFEQYAHTNCNSMRSGKKYISEHGRQFSVEHHPWQCGVFMKILCACQYFVRLLSDED